MLRQRIEKDLKTALLNKDSKRAGLLRLVKSEIMKAEIDLKKKGEFSDDEITKILRREAKKRQDSIEAYTKGGRNDLVDTEKEELGIINEYLPALLSEEAVREKIKNILAEIKPAGPRDFGMVMGRVMSELKGQADGGLVNKIVKEELEKI